MLISPLIEIVVFAVIAAILLGRLYMVLGRRTGSEPPPMRRAPAETAPAPVTPVDAPAAPRPDAVSGPVMPGLAAVRAADPGFDTDTFLGGARAAYEMILVAFAQGDRATLRPLLSDEVFAAFEGDIKAREARGEKIAFTFLSLADAAITQAGMAGTSAEVTVGFSAQVVSTRSAPDGKVIDGDCKTPRTISDVWTFARAVASNDPNWTLVATHGELP